MTVFNFLRDARTIYLMLLAVQIIGAMFLIVTVLPDFRQVALYPGQQLPYMRGDDFGLIVALVIMQGAYWVRLQRVPIPYQGSSVILSHIFLFLGRLSLIFGGALFAVVFFRHLPELGPSADAWLMARRGVLLVGMLFVLFCFTLELERLGAALGNNQQN
jgi:hypothetical protein